MLTAAAWDAYVARTMTERTWQAHVEQAARLCGWLVYHTYDSRRSAEGFPDLVLVRPPRCLFVELKTQRGRLTVWQEDWLRALAACPQVETAVWRPADRDAMLTILQS